MPHQVKEDDGIVLEYGSKAGSSVGTAIKAHAVKYCLGFHEVDSAMKASIR